MNTFDEEFKDANIDQISKGLKSAFNVGDKEKVKFLLNHPNLQNEYHFYKNFIDDSLSNACEKGFLDLVRYLLTSPELKYNADVNSRKGICLTFAARNGHLEIIKYLLTSPELKKHADIHAGKDSALIEAGAKNDLKMVKYLLTLPDLKEHADITSQYGYFLEICLKYNEDNSKMDILNFLIFEFNLEKDARMNELLRKYPNEEIDNLFKVKELKNRLEIDLSAINPKAAPTINKL